MDKCKEGLGDHLANWLGAYLSSASTGDTLYGDAIIEDYLDDGVTQNNLGITDMLDNAVSDGSNKTIGTALQKWIQAYTLQNKDFQKAEGLEYLYGLMNNYYATETRTGSDAMDNRIKDEDEYLLGKFAESAMNANKGGGGNANQEQPEPDTRYFFAVSLMYNDELRNAELERKGLDYDAKVEELEVE